MSRNFELLRQTGKTPEPIEGQVVSTITTVPAKPDRFARQAPSAAQEFTFDWAHMVEVLLRHWRWSALFAAVVVLTATAITFLMKPVYEPTATLEIDPPGAELFSLQGTGPSYNEAEYLQTQAQNLQSEQLALSVIRELHLDQNPEFAGRGEPDDTKQVKDIPGVPTITAPERRALFSFGQSLTVRRDTGSRIVNVSFASNNAETAALVTNTLVNRFIDSTYQSKHDAIMKSTQWLSRQLDDIKQRMEESNRALVDYQKASGIAPIDTGQSTLSEQMAELSRQYTQAQADRIQMQAMLGRLNSKDASLPQVASDPVIQDITRKLADARADLAQQSVIYGKNHPNVKKLQSQIDEMQQQLITQRNAIVSNLKNSYSAAQMREGLVHAQMKGTTEQLTSMAKYNALKKEAEANEQLYNNLFAKIKEAGITAESKSSNIRLVDPARVLHMPTKPNRLLNIAVGLLAGLLGGIVLAFVRESFDVKLHTPEDVRKCTGISTVSVMPLMESATARRFGLLKREVRGAPQLFLLDRPHSPEAEAVRNLQTSIRFARQGHPPQVLLVASAFPGEGKTTVAINLAFSLAHQGTVCLVDADLRRAGIASVFGITIQRGLIDVLKGEAQLEEALVAVAERPNLCVLPAGGSPSEPGEMILSDVMMDTITRLRQSFEFVIIDSPPLLAYADGRALSPLVDGIILVGRSGSTTRDALLRSMEMIENVHGAPIMDIVLNATDYKSMNYRYYGYSYRKTS